MALCSSLNTSLMKLSALSAAAPPLCAASCFTQVSLTFSLDPNLEPHILCYVPCGLILHTTEASFRHSNLLQENEFLIEPCSRTWTQDLNPDRVPGISPATADALASSSLTILRRQLPVNNTLACTAYNLQGKTLTGMFADLALPPGMKRVAWTPI